MDAPMLVVAAGYAHSAALRNDGKVVAWGTNSFGQTNVPAWLGIVKLVAAGGNQTLVSMYSPDVQYNVDAAHDLLLICNTNSADKK
jgi:alpha-tubulin suppressor-like RCC1 family protein